MIKVGIFKNLYNYRELLKTNIKKEIRGKYKGSWLGVIWTFLNPLLMLLVYSFVFPYILRVKVENYTMFMMIALIPWNFFTTAITSGVGCIVANDNLLKKVYFPREIIPISVVTSALVNFVITCIIMFVFIIASGLGFSIYALLMPLIIIIQYIFTLGFVFILSAITVFVRDVDHFVNVFLTLAFYGTPIIYTPEMLPDKFQWVIKLNPMAQMINAYRDILYKKQLPDFNSLGIWCAAGLTILIIGYLIFRKLERRFAEEL